MGTQSVNFKRLANILPNNFKPLARNFTSAFKRVVNRSDGLAGNAEEVGYIATIEALAEQGSDEHIACIDSLACAVGGGDNLPCEVGFRGYDL